MPLHSTFADKARPLGDHSADLRMIMLSAAAVPIGAGAGASTAALIAVAKHLRPDLCHSELERIAVQ